MKSVGLGVIVLRVAAVLLGSTSGVVLADSEAGNEASADGPKLAAPAAGVTNPVTTTTGAQVTLAATRAKVASAAPKATESAGHCPSGMVEVEGEYCPTVTQTCKRWLDPETKMRCAEFEPSSKCASRTSKKHFCIDKYEFPNVPGEKPVVMNTWYQARDACKAQGKRLCGESEWTLACEGQEHLPYPYGYARNADACNIDKPHPDPDEAAIADPKRRDAEVARLDQRDPSGARESCVSPFGVHDMTGNVDEWVVNESGRPYQSGLKGGYWGPVRTRCRPMTVAHNEAFSFYQIGFRCCSDAPAEGKVTAPADKGRGVSKAAAGLTGI